MKRSPELAPLSRDHHVALEAALRLRRADDASVTDAVARFAEFWNPTGQRHFEIEESILLPALPADDSEWGPASERIRLEHGDIRERAEALLEGEASPKAARELGERLNAHVRYEERELFPLLEKRLSPAELADIGRAVEEAERT